LQKQLETHAATAAATTVTTVTVYAMYLWQWWWMLIQSGGPDRGPKARESSSADFCIFNLKVACFGDSKTKSGAKMGTLLGLWSCSLVLPPLVCGINIR